MPGRAAPAQHPLPIADCSRPTDSKLGVGPCSALIHFPSGGPKGPPLPGPDPSPCTLLSTLGSWRIPLPHPCGPADLSAFVPASPSGSLFWQGPASPRQSTELVVFGYHEDGGAPPTWYGLRTSLTPSAAAPATQRRGATSLRTQSRPRAPDGQRGPWPKCPLPAGAPPCSVVSHSGFSPRPSLTQRGLGRPSRFTALSGELAPLCVVIKMRKPSPERSGNLPQSLSKAGPRPGQAGPGLSAQLGLDRAPPEAAALEKWLPAADDARDVSSEATSGAPPHLFLELWGRGGVGELAWGGGSWCGGSNGAGADRPLTHPAAPTLLCVWCSAGSPGKSGRKTSLLRGLGCLLGSLLRAWTPAGRAAAPDPHVAAERRVAPPLCRVESPALGPRSLGPHLAWV